MLKTENHFYFIYEYCNDGTLESIMHLNGTIQEEDAVKIICQIIKAFKVLVKDSILHRDLKPGNILFHQGNVKIADFGFCKDLEKNDLTKTMVGSPIYMAPEVLFGLPYGHTAEVKFYEQLQIYKKINFH